MQLPWKTEAFPCRAEAKGVGKRKLTPSADFWGPVSNFGIPVAAIMDTQKDPEMYVMNSLFYFFESTPRTSIHSRMSPLQTGWSSNELCFNWAHEHASLASTLPLCAEKDILPPALPKTYGARL